MARSRSSLFLVDTYCLGVKDCFFTTVSNSDYDNRMTHLTQNEDLERVEPEYALKLIEGAVAYAMGIGFNPHKEYALVKGIFGSIDPSEPVPVSLSSVRTASLFMSPDRMRPRQTRTESSLS